MGTRKQVKQSQSQRQGKAARRGRALYRKEPKQSLYLSLTPRTLEYLDRMADHAQTSISELLEDWVAGMLELVGSPMKPLGKGSRRKGTKALRGQAIHYSERKVPIHLTVTPTTKLGLQRLANQAHDDGEKPSRSDIVERWVISSIEHIDLMEAIAAWEQSQLEGT